MLRWLFCLSSFAASAWSGRLNYLEHHAPNSSDQHNRTKSGTQEGRHFTIGYIMCTPVWMSHSHLCGDNFHEIVFTFCNCAQSARIRCICRYVDRRVCCAKTITLLGAKRMPWRKHHHRSRYGFCLCCASKSTSRNHGSRWCPAHSLVLGLWLNKSNKRLRWLIKWILICVLFWCLGLVRGGVRMQFSHMPKKPSLRSPIS